MISELRELKKKLDDKSKEISKLNIAIDEFIQLVTIKNNEYIKLKDNYLIDKTKYEGIIQSLEDKLLPLNNNIQNNFISENHIMIKGNKNEICSINSEGTMSYGNLKILNSTKNEYNKPYNIPTLQLYEIHSYNAEFVNKKDIEKIINPNISKKNTIQKQIKPTIMKVEGNISLYLQ